MAETRQKHTKTCMCCQEVCQEPLASLQCANCKRWIHPVCLNLNESIISVARTYNWFCNDCKSCENCRSEDEENLVLCDSCDRGFHTHCLKPPLVSVPQTDWTCPLCITNSSSEKEEKDLKPNIRRRQGRRKTELNDDEPNKQRSKSMIDCPSSCTKRRRRDYSEFYNDRTSHVRQKSFPPSSPTCITPEKASSSKCDKKLNDEKCPVEGCTGEGHLSGKYYQHSFREACPLYHNQDDSDVEIVWSPKSIRATIKREEDHYNLRCPSKEHNLIMNEIETERESFDKNMRKNLSKSTLNCDFSNCAAKIEPELEDFAFSYDLQRFRDAQKKLAEELELQPEHRNKETNRIKLVRLGSFEIEAFYPSPYPEDVARSEKVFVCEFCLKYVKSLTQLRSHSCKCTLTKPPGKVIYDKRPLIVYEVDGAANKIYCQNLCLLAKLFLDHKTLYYDVEPFLFYILTEIDDDGCHIVGYFSKEKQSVMNCNLSCLLTLPPYQRKGYGKMLIELSYVLSRLEDKIGSPEHPLSDMGLSTYRGYWKDKILEYLTSKDENHGFSVKDLSQRSGIHVNDLISTLQFYGLVKYWRGEYWVLKKQELMEERRKSGSPKKKQSSKKVDTSCLFWPTSKQEHTVNCNE